MNKGKVTMSLLSALLFTTALGGGAIASANPDTNVSNLSGYNVNYSDIEKDITASLMSGQGYVKNSQTGEIINLEVESVTTELINNINAKNNESANQIKAEVRAVATLPGQGSDKAMGMTVYATLFYNNTTSSSGFTYVGLDKVSYRFEVSDSSYTVSAKKMLVSQNGVALDGKAISNQQRNQNLSDSGDILVRNWAWTSVLKNGLGYACGINITAVIQRGQSSSWDFLFNHPLT